MHSSLACLDQLYHCGVGWDRMVEGVADKPYIVLAAVDTFPEVLEEVIALGYELFEGEHDRGEG